jgi:hypothetical protein
VLVEVRDSGCGIDPALTERLFERLYQVSEKTQASRQGLGLGLFICKEVVSRQGGRIWARNATDKGSIFSFTLPVFSLASVLAPLLKDDRWPAETVALVRVDVSSPGTARGRRPAPDQSHEIETLLRRCLLPDLDVLLPRMGRVSGAQSFFIAAFAQDKGAGVLTTRIRRHLQRHLTLGAGQVLHVSHTMLEPVPDAAGPMIVEAAASLAARLEGSIRSTTATEVVLA